MRLLDEALQEVQRAVRPLPLEVSQDDLPVEASNNVLHPRVSLNRDALIRCGLNKEDLVRLRAKLEHHGCMVEFRARVRADNPPTAGVALEQEYVESICKFKELFFGDLLLAPEVVCFGGQRPLLEAFRSVDVKLDDLHPRGCLFFA